LAAAVSEAVKPAAQTDRARFLLNVIWGWGGVAVNMAVAFILSPIIVRKLGVERYGVWILLFSTMDYLRMLDFGFRAAVVNGCARFRACEDWEGVNRTVSPAMLYFLTIGVVSCVAAILLRDLALTFFNIPAGLQVESRTLIVIIAISVSLRLILAPLTATLEGFQRFDLVNRAYISALLFRSIGSLVVLVLGYGLVEMGYVLLVGQIGENAMTIAGVKRVFPSFHVSPSLVQREAMLSLFRYGRYSALMGVASLVTIQVPTTVLGYFHGPAAIAFFNLPFRLLMYSTEAFAKVADVTSSVTAGVEAKREIVWRIAVVTNRHCFTLFMPAAIFLWMFGSELLTVWYSPQVGGNSGPLLPVLVFAFLFAVAGQYNAGAVLIGQGRHALYAYGMVVEVIASAALLFVFVPRYGPLGAAWVVMATVVAIRCIFLSILMCRLNKFPWLKYISAIYTAPLMASLPVLPAAAALRAFVWPGRNWFELIAAGAVISLIYFGTAFFSVLEPGHRADLLGRVRRLGLLP